MNKKEVKKAPALRFKGFTNDWEQRKLGCLMNITSVKRIHQSDWRKKGIPFYRARDITALSKNLNIEEPIFISRDLYEEYSKISGKVQINDLLVTGVGTIGVPLLVQTVPLYFKDGNIIWFQNSNKLIGLFFLYLFKTNTVQKYIHTTTGVGTVPTYTIQSGKNTPVYITSKKEQKDIGTIFQLIDNLISLQQRKLELLSLIKKTIIKHLFKLKNSDSLNLKFKTSCSQWNSKKLGEIAKFINGRAFKQSELLNKGKYPVLRVGNFYTNDKWFYSDLNLNKNKYADKGDLLYTWSATFGPHIWKGPKVIFHYHIWKIDFDPSTVNKTFLFYFLEADKENLLTNSNGSTMIHITKSNMENKIINLPQFSIQQNIGTFLSNLDYLINQEKIKSKQLIQLKRFLLQNMFI